MTKKMYRGSCLCGMVKLTAKKLRDGRVCFCHCSQCRKNYGLYGAFVGIPKESLSVTESKNISWYQSSSKVRRGFCKKCGSAIFWEHNGGKNTYVLAGVIDGFKPRKGSHGVTRGGRLREVFFSVDALEALTTVPVGEPPERLGRRRDDDATDSLDETRERFPAALANIVGGIVEISVPLQRPRDADLGGDLLHDLFLLHASRGQD